MSPHDQKKNIPAAGKDETQSTTTRKTSSSAGKPQAPTSLKCPRCDSPNTKFCYYNNYSLTQPRHFCKTCRRYWTKGGALRNVPVGGGCRKNKKMKSSPGFSCDSSGGNTGGLKFFQGLSPAMDFQINLPNSTTGSSLFNKFSSLASTYSSDGINIISSSSPNNYFSTTAQLNDPSPLMGFSSFPSSSAIKQGHSILNNGSSTTTALSGFHNNNLASSIESLSCINQDLHSKLQQQRLSMMFVGDQKEIMQKPINLFENMDYNNSSKPDDQSCLVGTSRKDGNLSTEWFFDNSYATSSSNNNANDHQSSSREIYQAWSELTDQYTSLP